MLRWPKGGGRSEDLSWRGGSSWLAGRQCGNEALEPAGFISIPLICDASDTLTALWEEGSSARWLAFKKQRQPAQERDSCLTTRVPFK